MKTWKIIAPLMVLALFVLVSPNVPAAVLLTYVGADMDIGAGLRTTSVPKAFDADYNNVYGSLQYAFFHTNTLGSISTSTSDPLDSAVSSMQSPYGPLQIASVGATHSISYNGPPEYNAIDDPTSASPAPPDIRTGIMYFNGVSAGNYEMLTLVVAAPLPAHGVRIGLLTDNSPTGSQNVELRIRTISGSDVGSATTGTLVNNNLNDMYFFDLVGATVGEQFYVTVLTTAGGLTYPALAGLTVDEILLPEPSTVALLALGGLLAWRRKRG